MNEILDLQSDLHANGFAVCEEYTFGIRTLLFAFLFSSERIALHSMLKIAHRLLLTLQRFASVPWRSSRLLSQHMAFLVPLKSPASSWCSQQWRQIIQLRRKVNREFSSIPLLLCFLLSTFGHRRPYFSPHRFFFLCDLCFGHSTIHPMNNFVGGRLFRMRNFVDPIQLSERILSPSMFHDSSILLFSKLSNLVVVCLTTSMHFNGTEDDDSFGT